MKEKKIGTIAGLLCLLSLFCLIALFALLNRLNRPEVIAQVKTVTIPEGLTAVEISKLLQNEGVFVNGEMLPQEIEGYLFPDTYEFFVPSGLGFVVKKLSDNFNVKVPPNVPTGKNLKEILTVASLVEEEVAHDADRPIVAGIILKRLKSGMPLQIDSSICYIKPLPCHPIKSSDLDIDSPYNTYLYKGLPPGPISNPGLEAIIASVKPTHSGYWFYISDPKTRKIIFATTLEEQGANIYRYLK